MEGLGKRPNNSKHEPSLCREWFKCELTDCKPQCTQTGGVKYVCSDTLCRTKQPDYLNPAKLASAWQLLSSIEDLMQGETTLTFDVSPNRFSWTSSPYLLSCAGDKLSGRDFLQVSYAHASQVVSVRSERTSESIVGASVSSKLFTSNTLEGPHAASSALNLVSPVLCVCSTSTTAVISPVSLSTAATSITKVPARDTHRCSVETLLVVSGYSSPSLN